MGQLPKIALQRLQATGKAGPHPDPDLLTAFAEKSLTERERIQVLNHLGQCTDCREIVSLATPEALPSSISPVKSPRILAWPVLRWGALAACAVIVTAAVTLRYGRQQSAGPLTAEQAAAPAQSETRISDDKVSKELAQGPAEKNTQPLAVQSQRAPARRPSNLREDRVGNSAAGATVMNGLAAESQKNSPALTDRTATDPLLDKYQAKAEAPKSLQPMDKTSSAGQFAAPAPAAPTVAANSQASVADAKSKPRDEDLNQVMKSTNETVTVESEAIQVDTAQATAGITKDEANKKRANTTATGRTVRQLKASHDSAPTWTLSSDGALQRSYDSGKTWQAIPVTTSAVLRALAANGPDVWVGGTDGALFHSPDAGEHWAQVQPVVGGAPLTADIVGVEFSDAQHGTVTTSNHEKWKTADGGITWNRD
jgi:hypothetical protein